MVANLKMTNVRIAKDGRITIPPEFRRSLGLDVGQDATLQLVDDTLIVMNPEHVLRRAQKLVREGVPSDISLVEQLIADRRAEGRNE